MSIFVATALVGSIVVISGIDNQAFADEKKKKKVNEAEQGLGQNTTTAQAVDFPLPGTIDIFMDNLLIIDWKTITGILVTSSEIASIFVDYFDSIWKIAQK